MDAARRPGSIVSSNTSGIPIAALAEGRSDDFRRHWLGTHFFNPPRYLRLLEVIPTAETPPAVIDEVIELCRPPPRQGRGDGQGFAGVHRQPHRALRDRPQILARVAAGEYTIEEVDAITGPAIGRPKSATFRTLDLAGLDILAHVMRDLHERLPGAQRHVRAAVLRRADAGARAHRREGRTGLLQTSQERGRRVRDPDPRPLDARVPPARRTEASIARGRREPLPTRPNGFARSSTVRTTSAEFLRETLAPALVYTASRTAAIAHSPDDVDRVMRWGFGWELGPFELIDAIGVERVLDAAREHAPELLAGGVPPLLQAAVSAGRDTTREGSLPPAHPAFEILRSARDASRVVRKNAGASLVDLGDGVLCVEFHSKMNVIGGDTIQMLHAGVREASKNFAALVVGNEAANFSAGANLMLVLLEAQEENWDEIDLMVRAFQQTTMALRYADVPVVVAPAGLALGGGCEIALHGDRIQAAAETYIGLVEVGVGLIPAGGGTKEMTARAGEATVPGGDLLPPIQRAFETIGFAKVSTSAPDAQRLGYLRPTDAITMNRDRLIADAKALARLRARRRLSAAVATKRHPGGRRRGAGAAEARHPPRLARRPHQRPRRLDRPEAGDDHGGRNAAAPDDGHRAASARPRARSVPEPGRRAQERRNGCSTR